MQSLSKAGEFTVSHLPGKETETGVKWLPLAFQLAARSLQFPGTGFFPHPPVSQRLKVSQNKLLRKHRWQITQAHGSHLHRCSLNRPTLYFSWWQWLRLFSLCFIFFHAVISDQHCLSYRISFSPLVRLAILYWYFTPSTLEYHSHTAWV